MRVLDVKGNTEEKNSGKWKGYITASIAVPLDKTWQIGSDFSGLHKFVPIVEVCERLKGCNRAPGCLRFYTMNSATGLPGGRRKAWARDRLLNIEEETHSYTYAVEGSNMNLENCQITFKASDGKDGTTIVTWAWEVDPIKKSTKEKTLSDMSEFGCTFIKGLEAAVATTDSIDFNFEGALLDIDTLSDAGGDGDGGGPCDPPVPALCLMKSRLDTLTQSLNKICQQLENGPLPADLYQGELEILQSTLAEGRKSLVNHLHGYMSMDTRVGQSNKSFGTNDIAQRYEEFEDCPLLCETIVSKNNDSFESCKSEKGYEDCSLLSSGNVISRPQKADALPSKSVSASMCLDTRNGQYQACAAKFPKLASDEELRVEMDNASRCAYEAFQDFSNQFQSDLRDDISHQLQSVGIRLDTLDFHMQESPISGVKDQPSHVHPTTESQGGSIAVGAGQREDQEKTLITQQEISHHLKCPSSPSSESAKWPSSPSSDGTKGPSSHDAKVAPPGCQTLEDDRGQFGVWELDALRSQRLQGSTPGMHSVRFRSSLLFQDLLKMEMSQDSDHRSQETKVPPRTLQLTDSTHDTKQRKGSTPCCQPLLCWGQKSPPPQCPQAQRNVPFECHTQPQCSELGRFTKSPPVQDDNRRSQGTFKTQDKGLQVDHQTSEMYRRPLGTERHEAVLNKMSEDNGPQDFASPKESGERFQKIQNNSQGWKGWVSKMCGTTENLQPDLNRPQVTGKNLLEGSFPESSRNEFPRHNVLPRASRLPPDIWPDFPHEESGSERHHLKEGQLEDISEKGEIEEICKNLQGEDNIRRESSGHDLDMLELRKEQSFLGPASQEKRDIMPEPKSSSPPQNLENHHSESKIRSSECSLPAIHPDQVTLDLRNEIAPGVFHCRQGNQTRVVVNVPDGVEKREEIRCQMRSLHRKDEIYKEFELLGIQKPPTEKEILEGFAAARFQKQQELLALTETETPVIISPVLQPYYSDGKIWNPDARNSPIRDKSRFEQANDASPWDPTSFSRFRAGHSAGAKPPRGQNTGQPSKTRELSCSNATSRRQSATGPIFERMLESEQQVNVTNSFQRDARSMTSESLRGDPTAREMAMCDSDKTRTPWEGVRGRQDHQARVQTVQGSTYRHAYPPVQKREFLIMGHGQRTPHVQPSSSNTPKKSKSGASISSSSQTTTTNSGDNACPEHKSMGSGNSFAHLDTVDEISADHSASPEISVFYSHAEFLKRRDTPAIVASNAINLESRQSVVSPQSSSECSMGIILGNLERDAENTLRQKVMRARPSSRQISLDEVVDKLPSGSESSEFDPFRQSGQLGSTTYSESTTGSPEIRNYSKTQPLKNDSRHSVVVPQSVPSSPDFSRAAILRNFPQDPQDFRLLEMMRDKRPSPQLSLDEVLKNAPSESGSSEFDPYRSSGKVGSITCSGLNSSSGYSFTDQLIGHVPHFTRSGKGTSQTAAQTNPFIDFLMSSDNLAEGQQGSSNAVESRGSRGHEDCPFKQLKDKLDDVIQSSESSSPRNLEGRPQEINVRVSWADQRSQCHESSSSMGAGSGGTSSTRKNLAFSAILEGMTHSYDSSQQSDLNVILEEPGEFFDSLPKDCGRGDSQLSPSPISHRLSRKWNAEKVQRTYRDAQTQTDLPEEPEVTLNRSSQASRMPRFSGVDGLRTRQSNQMVESMANVAEFMDTQKSYSQMLEQSKETQNWSPQTSQVPRLPEVEGLKTQKMDSLANVAQFMDAQNSYSQMLDNVVGQTVESISSYKARKKREAEELAFRTRQSAQMLNSMLNVREFTDDSRSYSVWLDAMAPLSVIQTPMKDSEVQTPMNDSEVQTPWNDSESGLPREPRFREDSAANFLGSVAMQVLQEFGDSNTTEADTKGQLDPSLLSALSKQIVKEYTDYTNDQSRTEGQSEGSREPRFREQSALNFMSALSEHVLPEIRDRSGSQVIGVPIGGEPRFREKSAINFLSALKEQIMQRHGQSSISNLPSTSGPFQTTPSEYSETIKASEDQTYLAGDLNNQLDPNQTYPIENQVDLGNNQAYLKESVNSQTATENEAYPEENWNLLPDLQNQASSIESLNCHPESDGQMSPDEGSYQPASDGQAYLVDGLSHQHESEGQSFLGDGLGDQPHLESEAYPDEGLSHQHESEGQSSLGDGLGDQSHLEGQAYPDEGLSHQHESEGQSSLGDGLGDQPHLEGQAYPDEGLSYQRESEGQSSIGDGLGDQPDSEGQAYPDESISFQPESDGQNTPGGQVIDQPDPVDQPESKGQSSSGDQLDPEDLAFWNKGFTFDPESEDQGTPDQNFSDPPGPEGEAYPNEEWDGQPEGEAYGDDSLNDQVSPEGEAYPHEGLDDQTGPEGEGAADMAWNDESGVEGEAYPEASLNEPSEDQASASGSGTTDQEFGRNSHFQLGQRSSQRISQRSSQLNEMLQDLRTTVSRSRQNSVSNQGK